MSYLCEVCEAKAFARWHRKELDRVWGLFSLFLEWDCCGRKKEARQITSSFLSGGSACLLACCVTRTVNSPCSVLGKSRHRCHMKDAPLCTNHNMGYCDKYCNVGKRRHALSHGRCHWHQGTSNNLHKAAKCLWLRWNSPFFSGLFAYLPIRVSDLRVILKHLLLTIWPLRGLLM